MPFNNKPHLGTKYPQCNINCSWVRKTLGPAGTDSCRSVWGQLGSGLYQMPLSQGTHLHLKLLQIENCRQNNFGGPLGGLADSVPMLFGSPLGPGRFSRGQSPAPCLVAFSALIGWSPAQCDRESHLWSGASLPSSGAAQRGSWGGDSAHPAGRQDALP